MDELHGYQMDEIPSRQPDFFPAMTESNHIQNEKQRIHRI